MNGLRLQARDVSWMAQARTVLDRVTIGAQPGEVVGLLGPNGSGKSSLLRVVAGLRPLSGGTVHHDDQDLADLGRLAVARRVALVEQESSTEVDMRVHDVVDLGRIPHRDRWGSPAADDGLVIGEAMEQVGVAHLADRRWSALSGGERQRTHLARALAQQPSCLLLDEPTNHLDIRHQLELLSLLGTLDATCVTALHDLPLAARYCDRVVVLAAGRVVAEGPPAQALTRDLVAEVYGVRATITPLAPQPSRAGKTASRRGRADVRFEGLVHDPPALFTGSTR